MSITLLQEEILTQGVLEQVLIVGSNINHDRKYLSYMHGQVRELEVIRGSLQPGTKRIVKVRITLENN